MSYARFREDCNVYVFLNVGGYLECCMCWLGGFTTKRTVDMLNHLEAHKRAGHLVPDSVFDGLNRELVENDAWMVSPVDKRDARTDAL